MRRVRLPLAGLALVLACASGRAGTVHVASQEAGIVLAIDEGAATATSPVAVGGGPAQIAAGPDGALYVTHPDLRAVSVIDARAGAVPRRLPVDAQAFGIAVSGDGTSLFVGDWAGGRVIRLSARTGAVEGSVAVGREPAALVLDRRGRLYVADRESRQVSVVDTATMTRLATVAVGEGPFALTLGPKEDRLYVANVRSGDLTVVDTATLNPVATIPIGGMPYGVAASADGRLVLVTNQQAGTVVALDAERLVPRATIAVGRYPEGVVADGGRAYVANWFSDSVSVVDLGDLVETARIAVREGPRSLVVTPAAGIPLQAGGRP